MSQSETEPPSQPSSQAQTETQSHSSVHSTVRTKTDGAWEYTTQVIEGNGKKAYICKFCDKIMRGGGINRIKKHLAGIKGDVEPCKKVPADVRFTMQGILKQTELRGKGNVKDVGASVNIWDDDDDDGVEEIPLERKNEKQKGKRKATSEVHPFFTKGINDPSQPSIKKALQTKEKLHEVDLAIAMWFYDACIPMNACNSPYFQLAVDKIANIGHGYKTPNYHALRVNLLGDAKKQVSLLIDSYRSYWVESGCTIMSDGWRDIRHRHLINFLVYCEKGVSFIKSVDASDIESNSENLCNLFSEIVEMVGPNNVVQMVTDNAANYKLAGNDERIHTKKRNRLEHQRLNDLVYVHYNLRLKNRLKVDKRSYDPIDYECIDKTDFWVIEENPEGELDNDTLENMLDEQEQDQEPPSQEGSAFIIDDEDGNDANDDSEFQLLSDRVLDAL